ncbi:ribonuclease R family protein [cf. Phormidesmis sp. LEGE 11477]|uniref:ribonuclease R family protein n=1 Tax=cf. Phormidesmis sp. LEGE 11477 TaxID=1828680 RepID=UPI001881FEE0|nr:ribonuclease R family protein [cf. Phormidesmis sp. LEGE 11477]MBE9059690.1 VacB/RNase II family 3'-5' exoribonuclease [cf. Phormidesmis sp. LEGE 11477]
MEFSIASLLANLSSDKLVTVKTLEKKLNCNTEEAVRDLQIALTVLERTNVLEKSRGKYRKLEDEDVIEGKLRCSSKGFCFAIQDEEGADDIYVRESQLNTAWNGDRVLVQVTKDGSRRRSPEGEVKLVLERANESVLAKVKAGVKADETTTEETTADGVPSKFTAVPLDDRLLFELDITESEDDLSEAIDHLIHVEITRYPIAQYPPQGRVSRILGSDAEDAADIDIVYCKHDLPRIFSEDVFIAARGLPNRVRKSDTKGRLDLTENAALTIDGTNAKVIDDAISLDITDDGYRRLGIHISDVAHYVQPNDVIDRAARSRGMAVYLGDEIVPMLPPPIPNALCALVPDKDRLAISVLITLDDDGQVLEYEIQPSVIQVGHQLTYDQAQAILVREEDEELEKLGFSQDDIEEFEPVMDLIDSLYQLSQEVKQRRHERGSFELNLPQHEFPDEAEGLSEYLSPKFQYDDEGSLGAMVVSDHMPARIIVTEFMLLANHLVAKHIKELGIPGLYRVHRTPELADVQELVKLANNMELNIQLEDAEQVKASDYRNFTEQFAESKSEKVLTYLLLATLKPPLYSAQPGPHFGLAIDDAYTHFASPVRRYPDLLVHRLLHAVFKHGRDRRSSRSKDSVNLRHSSCHGKINWSVLPSAVQQEMEEQLARAPIKLTERERITQDAESDLEGLKKAAFMQAHTGEVFHGLITGVQSYGFFVELEELLVEGLVHVSSLKDDWYEYRSRQQKLVGRKNRQQYRLGDRVEVEVKSVDYYRQQIDLVAVGGGSEAGEDDGEPGEEE